jgi:oxygen-independent coproporphyrinogen-3 oxidase
MAGIYLHIPFCKKACHYCNFHFSTSQQQLPAMIGAMMQEAVLQHDYINEKVTTVYFGGGTPSLLKQDDLLAIIQKLRAVFTIAGEAEITLEANPDDISAENLAGWKDAGINRLSIGIQSFLEADLRWMNRAHNAVQAYTAVQLTQQAGFHNITIDLIYGTPGLSDAGWIQNIETAIGLNIPHLSCYALTVEPKTALYQLIKTKQVENVDAEKQARHFSILTSRLASVGFEHYEISNFAKPGFRSRHNSSYWQGKPYLGLGPSAHSFNGSSRQWNVANNGLYLKSIENNQVPFEQELLTPVQQLNEYIMTSLRTIEGLSLAQVTTNWGHEKAGQLLHAAQKHISAGHMVLIDHVLQLNAKGKLLADGVAADLFSD